MSLNGGYAMIKYNSTQEELQIAYRSKRPVLFYDENQRARRAVIEETATQSVDEETQEPITIYEYSYRLIDEASSVVANPTLSENEATLDGVEIDGTKYKVGGSGGKLYFHRITLPFNNNLHVSFVIISKKDSAYSYNEILSWLESLGTGAGWQGGIPACTSHTSSSIFALCVGYNSDGYISVFYWDGAKITRENLINKGITIYDNYIEV